MRDADGVAGAVIEQLTTRMLRGDEVTRSLATTLLQRRVIDAQRAEARALPAWSPTKDDTLDSIPRVPPRTVEDALLAQGISETLRAMPERQAHAWCLVNLHGLTYAEAADLMGTRRQSVHDRAERARLALVEALS